MNNNSRRASLSIDSDTDISTPGSASSPRADCRTLLLLVCHEAPPPRCSPTPSAPLWPKPPRLPLQTQHMAVLPSKRPRPRPHVVSKPAAVPAVAVGAAHASLSARTNAALDYASGLALNSLQPGLAAPNAVKAERDPSPGLPSVSSQLPGVDAAVAATATWLANGVAPGSAPAAPDGAAKRLQPEEDDDLAFFNRSRRRRLGAQPKKAAAMSDEAQPSSELPDPTAINPRDDFDSDANALLDLPEQSDDDDDSSTNSYASDDDDDDGTRKRRRKVKTAAETSAAKRKENASKLPAWVKEHGRKAKARSPSPSTILIDDSDDGKKANAEDEARRREKARVSLTPPPDERLYNKNEWSSYIQQAVHGSNGPQQIDDDDPVLLQLRKQQEEDDDDFEIAGVNYNPKLARYIKPVGGTVRSRRLQQGQGQSAGPSSSAARAGSSAGREEASSSPAPTGSKSGAANGASAEAGPSRLPGRAEARDHEPISIDSSPPPLLRPAEPSQASDKNQGKGKNRVASDGESDDSVQMLPRAPRRSDDRPSSPTFRRHHTGLDKGEAPGARASEARPNGDADSLAARSSPPIEWVHADADGDEAVGGGGPGNVSVDLRPETPIVEKIGVKVQGKKGLKLRLRLSLATKIQTIIDTVTDRAKRKKLLEEGETVRIVFDGEILDPNSTIEDADVEEDDQFEANW